MVGAELGVEEGTGAAVDQQVEVVDQPAEHHQVLRVRRQLFTAVPQVGVPGVALRLGPVLRERDQRFGRGP
ncbi:hypothetical protein GCM10010345_73750 [Streptomyces canarius]|uniref:Uncharacterized protein n=1 Tax=Streptomyces canarius TaxID=285453 RepID=A0ABQ3D6Y8_9ACTN|nr:hypothetical protein GCM10010345_73750 [Streptomyces canarius]